LPVIPLVKKSNEWDDRQLAKIKASKYYPDLIELEGWFIALTTQILFLLYVLLMIIFQDFQEANGHTSLYDKVQFGLILIICGITLLYWSLFRILPLAGKKLKEAKELKRKLKEQE